MDIWKKVLVVTGGVGFLFFVFVWVPYKKIEHRLIQTKQELTKTRNDLAELYETLRVLSQTSSALTTATVTIHFYTHTAAADTLSKTLASLPASLQATSSELSKKLPALIFYPGFSKNIQARISIPLTIDQKTLEQLGKTAAQTFAVNRALLNIMTFDPNRYFDRPLTEYESKELVKKLNALNEELGATEIALGTSTDLRAGLVLPMIKQQHGYVISLIDAIANGHTAQAESLKKQMQSALVTARSRVVSQRALMTDPVDPSLPAVIPDLIAQIDTALAAINEVQKNSY